MLAVRAATATATITAVAHPPAPAAAGGMCGSNDRQQYNNGASNYGE